MAVKYADLLDVMEQRAERLGLLTTADQKVDTVELEIYLFQGLLDILEAADIPDYTAYNDNFVQTEAGNPSYPVPDIFGRLLLPRVKNKRGFYLFDGQKNNDLEYIEPNSLLRHIGAPNKKPTQFTIAHRALWLSPTPDAVYTVRATYIIKPERPVLEDDVLLSYPTVLIDSALWRQATDMGKQVPALSTARQESLAKLLSGAR